MSGGRTFKDRLTQRVQEYLEGHRGKFIFWSTGRSRAQKYLSTISECKDVQSACDDFLAAGSKSVLGSSKDLRSRIGRSVCEEFDLEGALDKEIAQESVYPKRVDPRVEVEIMARLLQDKFIKEYREARLRRIQKSLSYDEQKYDPMSFLYNKLREHAPKYYRALQKQEKFTSLLKQLISDLRAGKVENEEIVIKAIIYDYEQRLFLEAKEAGLLKMAEAERDEAVNKIVVDLIEPMEFALMHNLKVSGIDLAGLHQELCDASSAKKMLNVRKMRI